MPRREGLQADNLQSGDLAGGPGRLALRAGRLPAHAPLKSPGARSHPIIPSRIRFPEIQFPNTYSVTSLSEVLRICDG